MAAAEPDARLCAMLDATFSADAPTRTAAGRGVEELKARPGAAAALATVASAGTSWAHAGDATRQLAACVLRQLVTKRWEELAQDERDEVQRLLPLALGDPVGVVRTAAAAAVSTIADCTGVGAYDAANACARDGGGGWPTLLPGLHQAIVAGAAAPAGSPQAYLGSGAMRCLEMLAEDLRGPALLSATAQLMPPLLNALGAGARACTPLTADALSFVAEAVAGLAMSEGGAQGRATARQLKTLLPGWLAAAAGLISECTASVDALVRACNGRAADSGGADAAVLRCLCARKALRLTQASLTGFGKYVQGELAAPLQAGWSLLMRARGAYAAASAHGCDGRALDARRVQEGLEAMLSQLLELLISVVEHPRFADSLEDAVGELAPCAVLYMRMTRDQQDEWAADANQYVADEDDFACSVRDGATMLAEELCEVYGETAMRALGAAVWGELGAADAARTAGDAHWWRGVEAALYAAGRICHQVQGTQHEGADGALQVRDAMCAARFCRPTCARASRQALTCVHHARAPQLPRLVEVCCSLLAGAGVNVGADSEELCFVRGRAMWMCSRYASSLSPDAAKDVTQRAAAALCSDGSPMPLRVCACRAIAALARRAKEEETSGVAGSKAVLVASLPAVYAGACAMAQQVDEDTLHLVLELFSSAIKLDAHAAAAAAGMVAPLALAVWQANYNDPLIAEDASEVLQELVGTAEHAAAAVLSRAVPGIRSMLTSGSASASGSEETGMLEASLHLLASITRRAPPAAARAAYEELAPATLACVSNDADSGVVQGACQALRAFVHAAGSAQELAAWAGGAAMQHMIECASRLLATGASAMSDRSIMFSGGFLRTLLARLPAGAEADGVSCAIAVGSAQRLVAQDAMPALKPTLALVLARCAQLRSATDVLHALGAGVGPAIEAWCEAHAEVQGAYEVRLSLHGLLALLATCSPVLLSTVVRGEPTDSSGGGMRTRSQVAKGGPQQYTQVPMGAKILGVLGASVSEAREAYAAPKGFKESDEFNFMGGGGGGGGGGDDDDGEFADYDDPYDLAADGDPSSFAGGAEVRVASPALPAPACLLSRSHAREGCVAPHARELTRVPPNWQAFDGSFGDDLFAMLGAQVEEGFGVEEDLDAIAETGLAKVDVEMSVKGAMQALAQSTEGSAMLASLAGHVSAKHAETLNALIAAL